MFIDAPYFDKLEERQDDELELLEGTECFEDGSSRLSCQIIMSDDLNGMRLTIAPEE